MHLLRAAGRKSKLAETMEKDRGWVHARPLSDGEGPTFPRTTRTSPFHMLMHAGPMPAVEALEGRYHRIAVLEERGAQHNPTVWVTKSGELHAVVRVLHGHKTTNYVGRVDEAWNLIDAKPVLSREPIGSIEDLRVFLWGGELWAIAATHNGAAPPVAIRQALLELTDDGSEILRVHAQPSIRHEKNWMPCVEGERLRLVYSAEPLVVLAVEGRRATPNAALVPQSTSHIRGGTQLVPWRDGYLALVHQVHRPPLVESGHNALLSSFWAPAIKDPVSGDAPVVYLHRFALFNQKLETVEFSDPFFFTKLGVEFASGLTWFEDQLVAAFGVADREAWIVEISTETVDMLLLKDDVEGDAKDDAKEGAKDGEFSDEPLT